jgi:hypothetical protein
MSARRVWICSLRDGNPYIAGFASKGFTNVFPAGVTPIVNTTCSACKGRVIPYYGVICSRDNSGTPTITVCRPPLPSANLYNQLTLTSAFTWSKTMDNISEVYSFLGSGSVVLAQVSIRARANADYRTITFPRRFPSRRPGTCRGKGTSRWYDRVAGGWTIGAFEVAQAGRLMTVVQQNLNVNPLEDSAAASFVGGGASMPPFLANPSAPLGSVGEFLSPLW